MRENFAYLVLLVIAVAVFTVFVCPYLEAHGLSWVCVLFYVVVILTFLYGRATGVRPRSRPPS